MGPEKNITGSDLRTSDKDVHDPLYDYFSQIRTFGRRTRKIRDVYDPLLTKKDMSNDIVHMLGSARAFEKKKDTMCMGRWFPFVSFDFVLFLSFFFVGFVL